MAIPQFQPLQVPDPLQQYATVQNILAAQQQRQANALNLEQARAKSQSDLLTSRLTQARQLFAMAPTADALARAARAQFDDPVLAPVLGRMGLTPDGLSASVLERSAAPGGFDQVKLEFISTADNMADVLKQRIASSREREEYEAAFPSAPRAPQPTAPAAAAAPTVAAETPMGEPVSLPTAPGAAPTTARAMPMGVEPQAMPVSRDLSEVNALAPAPAAAPVNAMLAGPMVPGALPADPYAARRQELIDLMGSRNARVVARAKAELDRLPKPPEAPKEFAPSSLSRLMAERDALPSGDPRRAAYDAAIAKETTRAEPTRVEVKLAPQEKEEQGARGKLLVKQYETVADAARLATRTLPSLDTQSNILDKGFKTGFGTDVQKAGASLLASLGVPEAAKFATDAQTFLAAAQQAVLQKQLEQKGVQTQADADRITQTGAQLGNTPEANRFIIDVTRAQLKRDIEQRNFYDKWWKENKTYDGAEDAWFSGEGGKSLFDRAELKKYGAARPAATPAAAAPATTGVAPYGDAEKERRYQEWKSRQGAR